MRTFRVGSVPCGTCRLCCENELVPLKDDEVGYEVEIRGDRRVLAHKPNKECVYLGEEGCSIYARRPSLCQDFDCRVLAVKLTKAKAAKVRCLDAWKQGRKRLAYI